MPNKEIYFPKGVDGYYDKGLQKYFGTKREKREYLNAHGLVEDGSMETQRHREERLTEIINEERRKQGLKPKSREQLTGRTR